MNKAREFFEFLKENEELAKELKEKLSAVSETDAEAQAELIAEFAKEKGFEFEAEDLTALKAESRPVSDDELKEVSGGWEWCALNLYCLSIFGRCKLLYI